MNGYAARLLHVDLTAGQMRVIALDAAHARNYIGASGLGARLFFDLTLARRVVPAPLGPDNPLLVMTGPLQGTSLPGSGRFVVCARSPLSGLWGESNCGGDFGPVLKFAGFDGIVITGTAKRPTTLWIENGEAELRPAADLWGKDTYETTDLLHAQEGKGTKALCIGPAGENLVRFASIVCDKGAIAGRTGMGAVMGAKRLKAIAVRGKDKVAIADPVSLKALRRRIQAKIEETVTLQSLKGFGTAASVYYNSLIGDICAKNWQQGTFDDAALLGLDGTTMTDTILKDDDSCYACPVRCKRVVEVAEGPFAMTKGPGPEYETVQAFGPLCMNADLNAVAKANDLCNRYGLDTISCGAVIAFATEATERGLLQTDLAWGNGEAMAHMVRSIARREGTGDLLAEGVQRAAAALGVPHADWVPHVKGLEVPMHDPRTYHGLAVGYATCPRGANHNGANVYVEMGSVIYPELNLNGDYVPRESAGKAYLSVMSQTIGGILDALTLCMFDAWAYSLPDLVTALNSVTGFGFDMPELLRTGERLWALKRSISCLLGATAADDRLPKRLLTALADGPTAGTAPALDVMLKEFYALCDLDAQGRPSAARLESLGLADVARLLHAAS